MSKIIEITESKLHEESLNTTDRQESSNEIEFKNVDNTPFTIVKQNKQYFGLIGQHRVTEGYDDYETCEKELIEINWNRLIQVIWAVAEKFNKIDIKQEENEQ